MKGPGISEIDLCAKLCFFQCNPRVTNRTVLSVTTDLQCTLPHSLDPLPWKAFIGMFYIAVYPNFSTTSSTAIVALRFSCEWAYRYMKHCKNKLAPCARKPSWAQAFKKHRLFLLRSSDRYPIAKNPDNQDIDKPPSRHVPNEQNASSSPTRLT